MIFPIIWPLLKWSEVAQSCLTLCNPMDCSLPGSSVHGIFQARILEWAAISFSRGTSQPRDRTRVSSIVGRHFTVWATLNGKIHVNFVGFFGFYKNPKSIFVVQLLSCVWLFVTPWTIAHQALLSMGFPRQEYWSGLPFPSPGDLPDLGIKPVSPALAGRFFTAEP